MVALLGFLQGGAGQTLLILLAPLAYTKGRAAWSAFQRWCSSLRVSAHSQKSSKRNRKVSPSKRARRKSRLRVILLVAACIACIIRARYGRPQNLFTEFAFPLDVSPQTLRVAYSRKYGLGESAHKLLGKLSSLDGRLAYIRLGAGPLLHCSYCHGYADYAFYSLPPRLCSYVLVASALGLLVHLDWRPAMSYTLGVVFIMETLPLFLPNLTQFTIAAPLAVYLHLARYLAFSVLLFVGLLLPERSSSSAQLLSALRDTMLVQERTAVRLRALQIRRAGIMTEEGLREKVVRHWQSVEQNTHSIRDASDVQAVEQRLGLMEGGEERRKLVQWIDRIFRMP